MYVSVAMLEQKSNQKYLIDMLPWSWKKEIAQKLENQICLFILETSECIFDFSKK